MTTEKLSKKHKIDRLLASKSGSGKANTYRTKITYAICEVSGYDGFYDFALDKKKPLDNLMTTDERVGFYENNRELLIAYAKQLATQYYLRAADMLVGMSYKNGIEVPPNNREVVSEIFLNQNTDHPNYKGHVSIFIENLCWGMAQAAAHVGLSD